MIKKYLGITLIATSLVMAGCSSDDDDEPPATTDGTTTDGTTTDGTTTAGNGGETPAAPADLTAAAGANYDAADPAGDGSVPAATLNLLEVASSVDDLSTLVGAASTCGADASFDIAGALANPDARLTVFAPVNAAFEEQAIVDALAAPDADVCAIIADHVIADTVANAAALRGTTMDMGVDEAPGEGEVPVDGVEEVVGEVTEGESNIGKTITMLSGNTVTIGEDDAGGLTIGGAPVTAPDNYATNGVAHIIGAVIAPDAAEDPGTTTDGDGGATTDGETTDGGGGTGQEGSIVAGLEAAGNYTIILGALESAGLTSTLDGSSNDTFTLFAPTDESLAGATLPEGDDLNALLLTHVVTGSLSAEDLATIAADTGTVPTANNAVLAVESDGTNLTVGGATVVSADNGDAAGGGDLFHGIDGTVTPNP